MSHIREIIMAVFFLAIMLGLLGGVICLGMKCGGAETNSTLAPIFATGTEGIQPQ